MLLFAVVAWGCGEADEQGTGGSGSDGSDGSDTMSLPSPYADSDGGTDQTPPSLDEGQVVTAAVAGLQAFVALQPDKVVAAYQAIAQGAAEPGCPEEFETFDDAEGTTIIWYAGQGCTTAAGVQFRGGGRITTASVAEGDTTLDRSALSSEGSTLRVASADGRFFELSGYIAVERTVGPMVTESGFEVLGEFGADEATAAGSALLGGSLNAQGYIYSYAAGATKVLIGSGSLSGDALDGYEALSFSDLLVAPDSCAAEPLGTVSVRDQGGYWHDIVFDAGTYDPGSEQAPSYDAAACDGCGAYLVGGERSGEACMSAAELGSLVAWEGSPW